MASSRREASGERTTWIHNTSPPPGADRKNPGNLSQLNTNENMSQQPSPSPSPGQESALATPPKSKKTLRDVLLSPEVVSSLAGVASATLSGERLANVLWACVQKTPDLGECAPLTLISACKTLAIMGCEPDGIHGYLVPYKNKKTGITTATPIPSARGLMRMARLSGCVQGLHLGTVYPSDSFSWGIYGGELRVNHSPAWDHDNEEPVGYYVVWKDNHGNTMGERMSRKEVEAIRERSNAWQAFRSYGRTCPWVTDPEQMALKTVLKRAAKRWDFPVEIQQAMVEADNAEFGRHLRDVSPARKVVAPAFLSAPADAEVVETTETEQTDEL